MASSREPGLGAIRQIRRELKVATRQKMQTDMRIRRLRAAEAALLGAKSPNAKVLSKEKIATTLAEHPGLRAIEIADELRAPPRSVRTLLSTMKRQGEAVNRQQRWYPTQ